MTTLALIAVLGAGLLMPQEALEDRKARLDEEPLASWWKESKDAADAAMAREKPPEGHRDLARALKVLAFAHAMTGEERYAARARDWFPAVRPEDYATGTPKNGVLSDSSAAKDLAFAHDLVGGPVELLREVARRMDTYDPGWYGGQKNNWQVRQYSAAGLLGLALDDEKLVARSVSRVKLALLYQICDDGAFAEGHAYLAYSADLYLPFAWALRNVRKDELLSWEPLAKAHEWSVRSRLPDGRRPNFDDAHLGYFPSHAVPDPVMRWDWEHFADRGHWGLDVVESIAFFPPLEPQAPPWEPSVVFRQGGDVIFRTDWGPEASMLVLRAESGKARANSGGHEHPDNLSFLYVAKGKMALIDSGYINYDEHHRVNKAENHNVVLIDGKGPTAGNEVEILEVAPTCVRLRTSYAGATIERTVLWEDGVVTFEDTIDAAEAKEVTYLFHLMSGGPGISVEIDLPATWTESEAEHSFDWGKAENHVVRRASGPPGRFVVRIAPAR